MSLLQNRLFLFVVIFSAVMCIAFPSFSYDIYVNKTEDTNDGNCNDDDCSLREAIIEANTVGAGLATIHVPAGRYFITREGSGEDNADTGDLDIKNSMTIVGEGMDATIINALGLFGVHDRVFHVNAQTGTVSFKDLGIYGGYKSPLGGGVLITDAEDVSFLRCHLYANSAGWGGAIYMGNDEFRPLNNKLTITECLIERNEALVWGGGIHTRYIELSIDSSTITGNSASQLAGGLAAVYTTAEIINSTFYKNVASYASEMFFGTGSVGTFSHSTLVSSELNVETVNITYSQSVAPMEFRNSIVWGKCNSEEYFISWGGTMGEPSNSCGFSPVDDIILESAPILLPLGDYGGPTPTAPPGLGSLAIDTGVFDVSNPKFDQRGVERPQAVKGTLPTYDIGSVEKESFTNIFKGLINDLRHMVKAPSIPSGIQKSLYSKVANSDKSYDKGDFVSAANKLGALNNSVEAQREKALTNTQAVNIIFLSNEAITFLENED